MTIEERLERYLGKDPQIHPSAYVSRAATLIGDVSIEADASVWPGCVLRADINSIKLGRGSNLQDGTVVHLADDAGVEIGEYTTVGHGAILHACKIGNGCLIGMGAVVLDKAEIGDGSIVGAGALVTKGTVVPPGSLVLGSPAKVVKPLDDKTREGLTYWSHKYVKLAAANKAKEQSLK
ncbi:MAG: gamma carbonic anhydrase family protein [Verrucomicrobia bacterium]|nr:MAG: gamma carbonic anhydrase family protein [Verrucomicrobiota bacterium]